MATGTERDDAALEAGLRRWVAAHAEVVRAMAGPGGAESAAGVARGDGAPLSLVALAHAEGGQANETILVDLGPSHPGHGGASAATRAHVPGLRPRAAGAGPERRRRHRRAGAGAGGGRDRSRSGSARPSWPCPAWWATSRARPRSSTPTCVTPGPRCQRVMHDQLLDTWPTSMPSIGRPATSAPSLPGVQLRDAVERWVAYVEWSSEGDPLPALEQALDWCARHVPAERATVLLWGDVRLGNLVFDPERRRHRRARLGPGVARPAGDGSRLAPRPRVHDGGVVRRAPARLPRRDRGAGALRAVAPGTR